MSQEPNNKTNIADIIQDITDIENKIKEMKEKISLLGGDTDTSQNLQHAIGIDFSLPQRAFMTKYATGVGKNKKSGAQKFVLVIAYLKKGQIKQDVSFDEIKKCWNTMSGKKKLGTFNSFYSSDAKNEGWVDSPKHGVYHLREGWQEVLKSKLK